MHRDHTRREREIHRQAQTTDQGLGLGAGHVTTTSISARTPPFTAAVASGDNRSSRAIPFLSPAGPRSNLSSADWQEIGFYRSLIDR